MIDTTPTFKMPKSPLSDYPEDSTQDAAFNEGVSALQAEQHERNEQLYEEGFVDGKKEGQKEGYEIGCKEHDDAAYDTGYADALEGIVPLPITTTRSGIVPEIDMFQGFGIPAIYNSSLPSDCVKGVDVSDGTSDNSVVRVFDTGATRDTAEGKLDYEGFLSPSVLRRYAQYMNDNRVQSDGSVRDSDNWQKGIPLESYMKSLWRHIMDAWTMHREWHVVLGRLAIGRAPALLETALCAIIFNASGYLHEILKDGDS